MSELFESPVQVKLRSTGSDRPCLLHADASLVADLSTPERRSLTNHWSPSFRTCWTDASYAPVCLQQWAGV